METPVDKDTLAVLFGGAGILGGVGAFIKVVFDYLSSSKKQDNDISSKRISELEVKVEVLHKEHLLCTQKAVEAATELRLMQLRIKEIEDDRAYLRSEVHRLEKLVHELQGK